MCGVNYIQYIQYTYSYIDSSKLTKKGAFRRLLPQKQDRWQQGILSLKSANIVYIHSTKRHHQVYKVFWKMAGNYRKYGKNSNYFLKRSKVSNHPDLLLRLPRVYIVKYYCSWRYVWAYGNIAPVNTVRHLVVSLVINALPVQLERTSHKSAVCIDKISVNQGWDKLKVQV